MASHVQRVRILYKSILKLHRGLPAEVQELGNQYVRDEFKRHKTLKDTDDQIKVFMWEWTDYAINLAKQLSVQNIQQEEKIGKNLYVEELDRFNDEQIVQLNELYLASKGKESESEVAEDKK